MARKTEDVVPGTGPGSGPRTIEQVAPAARALFRALASALPSRPDGRAIATEVAAAGRLSDGIAQGIEREFVGLARELHLLHACASDLGQQADKRIQAVRNQLAETRLSGPEGVMGQALTTLHNGLDEAGEMLKTLQLLSQGVSALTRHSTEMTRIARYLKIAGYSFAVESSRTDDSARDFADFVADLRNLSDRTVELGEAIGDQAKDTEAELDTAVSVISSSLSGLCTVRHETEARVAATLSQVQTLLDFSLQVLAGAEAKTKSIAHHVNEAVYYLQFGDILRQKLEHVVSGFEDAAQFLRADTQSKPEAVTAGERASRADRLVEIQVAQLRMMQSEIHSAMQRLEAAFSGIGREADGLVCAMSALCGDEQSTASGGNSFVSLQAELSELQGLQSRGSELCGKAQAITAQAMAAISTLSGHLGELQQINVQMHRHGLNAVIRAAGLGENGRALALLSQQIHGIFQDSRTVVTTTAQVVSEIESHHASRDRGIPGNAGGGIETVRPQGLEAGIQSLSRISSEFQRTVVFSRALAEQQKTQVNHAREQLEVLTRVSDQISNLLSRCDGLRIQLAPFKQRYRAPVVMDAGDVGTARYTVASEREIHLRLSGVQAEGVATSPAYSGGQSMSDPTDAAPDDNIELF